MKKIVQLPLATAVKSGLVSPSPSQMLLASVSSRLRSLLGLPLFTDTRCCKGELTSVVLRPRGAQNQQTHRDQKMISAGFTPSGFLLTTTCSVSLV